MSPNSRFAVAAYRELLDCFALADMPLPPQTGMVGLSRNPGPLVRTQYGGLSMGTLIERATEAEIVAALIRSMVDTSAGMNRSGPRWQACARAVAAQMPSAGLVAPSFSSQFVVQGAAADRWPYHKVWLPKHADLVAWFRRRAELRRVVDAQWSEVRADFAAAFGAAAAAAKLPPSIMLVDRRALADDWDTSEARGLHVWQEGEPRGDILIPDDAEPDPADLADTLIHEAVHGFCPRDDGSPDHGELYAEVASSFVEAMRGRRPIAGVPWTFGHGEQAATWPAVTPERRRVIQQQFESERWRRNAGASTIFAPAGR